MSIWIYQLPNARNINSSICKEDFAFGAASTITCGATPMVVDVTVAVIAEEDLRRRDKPVFIVSSPNLLRKKSP